MVSGTSVLDWEKLMPLRVSDHTVQPWCRKINKKREH